MRFIYVYLHKQKTSVRDKHKKDVSNKDKIYFFLLPLLTLEDVYRVDVNVCKCAQNKREFVQFSNNIKFPKGNFLLE